MERGRRLSAEPSPVHHTAVIGGGAMGAGICHALIRAGLPVRLVEVSAEAASAALRRIRSHLDEDVKARRLSPLEAQQAMHRVSPTADGLPDAGLKLADFVIEAVAEKIDVKRQVFEVLDKQVRADAVLASNTSSLSITSLAETTRHPERVIGLHFFNPVPKMPLVEVICTAHSHESALATGATLAAGFGKVPIVVQDSPGFLVNRLLLPYLAEALTMASEGADIDRVDHAMKQWGMPMGPFELLDQVGLDIAIDIFKSVGGRLGDHLQIPMDLEVATGAAGGPYLGRKTGRGFYDYRHRRRGRGKPPINQDLMNRLCSHGSLEVVDSGEIQWRLVLPMINEAARLLTEGVMDSTDLIDLATVLGLGLAPFRGGLIRFADTVGLDQIVRHMGRLAGLGAGGTGRLTPVPELRELAEMNRPMGTLAEAHKARTSPSPQHVPDQTHPQRA